MSSTNSGDFVVGRHFLNALTPKCGVTCLIFPGGIIFFSLFYRLPVSFRINCQYVSCFWKT